MKLLSSCCMAAGLGVLFTSCASEQALTRVEVRTAPSGRVSSIEARIHDQVNAFRRSRGLGSMERHDGLDRMARQHARFMLKNRGKFGLHGSTVTHHGFEERCLAARHHMNMETLAENVIAGKSGSGDVGGTLVKVWVGSREHLNNLTDDWQVTGVGVAVGEDGMVCATQLFGVESVQGSRFAFAGSRWMY